jgi:hypothetical protein
MHTFFIALFLLPVPEISGSPDKGLKQTPAPVRPLEAAVT